MLLRRIQIDSDVRALKAALVALIIKNGKVYLAGAYKPHPCSQHSYNPITSPPSPTLRFTPESFAGESKVRCCVRGEGERHNSV